jgi:hypothetical protein
MPRVHQKLWAKAWVRRDGAPGLRTAATEGGAPVGHPPPTSSGSPTVGSSPFTPLLRGDLPATDLEFETGLRWLLDGIERAYS